MMELKNCSPKNDQDILIALLIESCEIYHNDFEKVRNESVEDNNIFVPAV